MMGLYRKKPVVIEAFQFSGGSNADPGIPSWFIDAVLDGKVTAASNSIAITTLEGVMQAAPGDWIIRGVKGELYPCKPDIFAEIYEPADSATSIERNQVIPAKTELKREDSVLETFDGAGDLVENVGGPVVIAPYRKPSDPRVKDLIPDSPQRAREREQREQQGLKPRQIFTDPRLNPDYRPPRQPKK
jgi:hypothetical protein